MSLAPPPTHPAPPDLPEVPDGVTPDPGFPRWHPGTAIAAFITAFLVAGVGSTIVIVAAGDIEDPKPGALIGATVLQDILLVSVALGFAAMASRPRAWHFGFVRTRFWPAVGWSALVYVGYAAFSLAYLTAIGADQADDLPKELGADESTGAAIGLAILVTVAAPLAEEFFFRGYLFGALRRWRGPAVGAVIVGILFGLVHAGGSDPAYLVPLAVLGGLFCLLYAKTGSLYPAIVLHTINNAVAYSIALDWGWQLPVLLTGSLATVTAIMLSVARLGGPVPRGLRPA